MKRKLLLMCLLLIVSTAAGGCGPEAEVPGGGDGADSSQVSAAVPTDMAFAKNGDLYFTEKDGALKVLPAGRGKPRTLLSIPVPELTGYSETGLLGIALAPDFVESRALYLYHTYEKPGLHTTYQFPNKVIRVDLDRTSERQVIIEGLPGSNIHNAGKLLFGQDGKLYIAVGDAGREGLAQDKAALNGKVLRLNADGSVPSDNPFPDSPVFSYGHRNIFGMAFTPGGRLIVTENGPESNDEVNLVEAGKNYGWPETTGDSGGRFQDPLVVFRQVNAPTGIIYFKPVGKNYLPQLSGKMVFADYINGDVHVLPLGKGKATSEVAFSTGRSITAISQAPDGRLWIAQENRIYEVAPR